MSDGSGTTTYTYDNADRLITKGILSYTYDAAGNLATLSSCHDKDECAKSVPNALAHFVTDRKPAEKRASRARCQCL